MSGAIFGRTRKPEASRFYLEYPAQGKTTSHICVSGVSWRANGAWAGNILMWNERGGLNLSSPL